MRTNISENEKPFAAAVLANRQERIYPEGYYCLRLYRGQIPVYKNVGTDPTEALLAKQIAEQMHAKTIHIASSHVPMLSHPTEVANFIAGAAGSQ